MSLAIARRSFFRALCFSLLLTSSTLTASAAFKWDGLSPREKTFLNIVFSGDESKAAEYVQMSGLNVNAIGGEPLSVWFYRQGLGPNGGSTYYRDLNVQRIVFERFRQNPNVQVDETQLGRYCNYAPYPENGAINQSGTPEQRRALAERQFAARKQHVDAMAAGFDSLVRYGLKDRKLINEIFIGCFFNSATPMVDSTINEYAYDTMISRLIRAGADINGKAPGGDIPIRYAVKSLAVPIVERLVRDGANLQTPMQSQCGPSSLYGFLMSATQKPQAVLQITTALTAGGLPPTAPASYTTSNGYGQCRAVKTFIDGLIDLGNLELAKAVKEAAEKAKPIRQASASAPTPSQPAVTPTQFGGWRVTAGPDGRPIAFAKLVDSNDMFMKELRIECVAGGRLEYVPVPRSEPLRALWIDNSFAPVAVTNGRVTGSAAAQLSKEFLKTEAEATKAGAGADWSVGLIINDDKRAGSMVHGDGFSKARSFLFEHCKA